MQEEQGTVCYIGTMFMQVDQGTKHPEASLRHKFTQMFTVVIGYPRNYQKRVIKLIRGSKILNNATVTVNASYCVIKSMNINGKRTQGGQKYTSMKFLIKDKD